MFGLLRGRHGVLEDLRCADDNVGILHHPAEEVLLLTVPTDMHYVVVPAQVRLELVLVMLLHKVYLSNSSKKQNKTKNPSSTSPTSYC